MPRRGGQLRVCHPQILLPLSLLPPTHRHEQSLRTKPVDTAKKVLDAHQDFNHGLIGAGMARAFASQGAKVFLHYLRQTEASPLDAAGRASTPGELFYRSQQAKSADEVLTEVRQMGVTADAWEADLADASLIPLIYDRAEERLGPVEILVNNAAYWEADTFVPSGADLNNKLVELWTDRPKTVAQAGFDRLFAVNTRAPALMIAEFARRHIERRARQGRIINVSTAGAERFPSEISYGASKYALESYTRSAAMELGKFGISVNVVSLGPVQTGWITAELEREILPTIPLGRTGSPEDVANVVVFLASDQARWVTGQRIYVSGGHGM
jgi:3-oxoacyl-[acyl-carrier protein] reductase